MSELSTFLFARPSFAEGIARLLDFGGTLNEYNYSPTEECADSFALWADNTAVGNDVRSAWLDELVKAKGNVKKLQKTEAAS
jgi:hypothetical protein